MDEAFSSSVIMASRELSHVGCMTWIGRRETSKSTKDERKRRRDFRIHLGSEMSSRFRAHGN